MCSDKTKAVVLHLCCLSCCFLIRSFSCSAFHFLFLSLSGRCFQWASGLHIDFQCWTLVCVCVCVCTHAHFSFLTLSFTPTDTNWRRSWLGAALNISSTSSTSSSSSSSSSSLSSLSLSLARSFTHSLYHTGSITYSLHFLLPDSLGRFSAKRFPFLSPFPFHSLWAHHLSVLPKKKRKGWGTERWRAMGSVARFGWKSYDNLTNLGVIGETFRTVSIFWISAHILLLHTFQFSTILFFRMTHHFTWINPTHLCMYSGVHKRKDLNFQEKEKGLFLWNIWFAINKVLYLKIWNDNVKVGWRSGAVARSVGSKQ